MYKEIWHSVIYFLNKILKGTSSGARLVCNGDAVANPPQGLKAPPPPAPATIFKVSQE